MSLYILQKLIREINRSSATRARFTDDPDALLAEYDLCEEEREALAGCNYRKLYALGVHGLLLRPFSILHQVPEAEYLEQIRGEAP